MKHFATKRLSFGATIVGLTALLAGCTPQSMQTVAPMQGMAMSGISMAESIWSQENAAQMQRQEMQQQIDLMNAERQRYNP